MSRKQVVIGIEKEILGLVIFALGAYLTIKAGIGLAPWESFSMGISMHIPLTYGLTHSMIGLMIMTFDLILKEKIGYGTILDAIVVGISVDIYTKLDFTPVPSSLVVSIIIVIIGLFIEGIGRYFCMSAGLSCGPRDTLMIGIGKKLRNVKIGTINLVMVVTVFCIGWMLGSPVGIGTVISTFGIGITMQIVFDILKFEPRDVKQIGFIETTKILIGKKEAEV